VTAQTATCNDLSGMELFINTAIHRGARQDARLL